MVNYWKLFNMLLDDGISHAMVHLLAYWYSHLRDLITIQSARSTRSSSLVTLLHPPVQSNLKITKRSFRHAAPASAISSYSIYRFYPILL